MRKIKIKAFLTTAILIMSLAACGKKDDKKDDGTGDTTISTESSSDASTEASTSDTEASTNDTESTSDSTEAATGNTEASTGTTEASTGDLVTTESGTGISGFDFGGNTTESAISMNGMADGMDGMGINGGTGNGGFDSVNAEICTKYMKVLAEHESAINAYNFQFSYAAYSDIVPEDNTTRPIAFSDVNGSGVRDMLFITAENDHSARLNIYTFFDSDAYEIYNEYIDVQVGGAASYCLFRVKNNPHLFIYRSYGDQNWTDTIMELSFETYPFTKVHEWTVERTYDESSGAADILCYIDGDPVTQNEFMTASMDYYDNIDEILMYNGALTNTEFLDFIRNNGCNALSYESSISMLETGGASQNGNFVDPDGNGGNNTDPNSNNNNQPGDTDEVFKDLPIFYFSSGAGGWATVLNIMADGSFTGTYSDTNFGETGDDYPNGTIYLSVFYGNFTDVKKVADYTYTMKMESIEFAYDAGQEWVDQDQGIKYIVTPPYGLEADTSTVYTLYSPGADTKSMTEDFLSWIGSPLVMNPSDIPDPFPYYGIYNPTSGTGFLGMPDEYN